ncbi:MAG: hypothetical protein ACYDER_01340 [Ktedonobacteraceae bacterium]
MDSVVATLLGAAIGAGTGLLSALISNWLIIHHQKELWKWQQDTERQKQIRTELYEIYRNCIYYLSALSERRLLGQSINIKPEEEYAQLTAHRDEAERWVLMLRIYEDINMAIDLKEFHKRLDKFFDSPLNSKEEAHELREYVSIIASYDQRLKYKDMSLTL